MDTYTTWNKIIPTPYPSITQLWFYITFENIVLVFYKFAIASRHGTQTNFSTAVDSEQFWLAPLNDSITFEEPGNVIINTQIKERRRGQFF